MGGCDCHDNENALCEIHKFINGNPTFFQALTDLHYATQITQAEKGRDVTYMLESKE